MKKKISELSNVLRLAQEIELAKLAAIADDKSKLLLELELLRNLKSTKQDSQIPAKTVELSKILGADLKWQQWVTDQVRAKNIVLAGVYAKFEEQKLKAQKTVGRKNAFDKLIQRRTQRLISK